MSLTLIPILCGVPLQVEAQSLSLGEVARLARQCAPNVAVSTLAAIARTESGFDPLALHDNTNRIDGSPQGAAVGASIASRLIAAGHSVDIGLMQVNSANLPALGLTVASALDPCRSIAAGAAILAGDYAGGATHAERQAALRMAISRYNTGDADRGFLNGYVHKVELSNARVVPALDVAGGDSGNTRPTGKTPDAASSAPPGPPSWDVFPSAPVSASTHAWEVFPPDPAPASPRPSPRGPTFGHDALTVADAGEGPSAAVTDYPGPATNEAP